MNVNHINKLCIISKCVEVYGQPRTSKDKLLKLRSNSRRDQNYIY